jgi:hypothetical protein
MGLFAEKRGHTSSTLGALDASGHVIHTTNKPITKIYTLTHTQRTHAQAGTSVVKLSTRCEWCLEPYKVASVSKTNCTCVLDIMQARKRSYENCTSKRKLINIIKLGSLFFRSVNSTVQWIKMLHSSL